MSAAKVTSLTRMIVSVLVAAFVCISCKEKQDNKNLPPKPAPKVSSLQEEIDRVRDIKVERDPAKRPIPFSKPAKDRRTWTIQELNRAYSQISPATNAWDVPVQAAFEDYASLSTGETAAWPKLETDLMAIPTNCPDPMVQYMKLRYLPSKSTLSPEATAIAFLRTQEQMLTSPYHPAFKFIAGARAISVVRLAEPSTILEARIVLIQASLEDLARDTNAPSELVFDMVQIWLQSNLNSQWFDFVMHDLASNLEHNFGREERWYRLGGWVEIEQGWSARGPGFARTVTDEGWRQLARHLLEAEKLLTVAWQMDPSQAETAYLMMRVSIGQGQTRQQMESWFNRAMQLQPNYVDAARLMALYLEPAWHGSEQEVLQFGRTCVTNQNWSGPVPLVLVDAHHDLANFYKLTNSPAYWGQPQVWVDVSAAYGQFFKRNTNVAAWRQNFARDAFLCGQYQRFLEETKSFVGPTNFTIFGGETKFKEMLAKAAASVAR